MNKDSIKKIIESNFSVQQKQIAKINRTANINDSIVLNGYTPYSIIIM